VAERSYGNRLRHVADVMETVLGEVAPLGIVDHVYEPLKVQLRSEDFAHVFAGKCVRARNVGDHRHYEIIVDGVEFNSCERMEAAHSTVTLPAPEPEAP
jgi:hypothetical protein